MCAKSNEEVMKKATIVCVSLMATYLILTGMSFAEIAPETIVGIWLFDEGNGQIAKDLSEESNDGALMKGPKDRELNNLCIWYRRVVPLG